MERLNLYIALGAFLVALGALLFSIYTHWKHDRKIKEQSSLLNQYHLEKIQKEKEASKKADFQARVFPENGAYWFIEIANRGKSNAKNVQVDIPESGELLITQDFFPTDIKSQNQVKIPMMLSEVSPDFLTLKISWEDEFSSYNQDELTVQLL